MQAFAVAGLILDIVGAIVLSVAVFGRGPERALQESSGQWNWHPNLHLSLATQTADAQAGVLLLVMGFIGQGISAAGANPECRAAQIAIPLGAGVIVLAAVGLLVLWLRPEARRNAFAAQLRAQKPEVSWEVIRDYAYPVGDVIREGPSETPAAQAERLLGSRRWRALVAQATRFDRELPENLTSDWHPDHST